MQSAQLRMNALQDAFPHDRTIRDSLTIVEGNMNRIAPEGAATRPAEGVMLSYGEVGQLQGLGMKVAKTSIPLAEGDLEAIVKRGSLVNSDSPTRFAGAPAGDYNAAIVYAKGASEQVYQAALARADEFIAKGANASREDLAYWTLRDKGFDAINHADGSTTALYPRQQVKQVSDFVNKSSREYTEAPKAPPAATASGVVEAGRPETSKAPSMLGGEKDRLDWLMESANREANTRLVPLGNGQYQLHMFGMDSPVSGDLDTVTDVFLTRSTTTSHLRASLQSEGMDLRFSNGEYSIIDKDSRCGANPSEAMVNAK